MVWHIFKKDWTLMWRSGAAVAALELAYAFVQIQGEFGNGNPVLQELRVMMSFLWLIAAVIWVVMLVHQDALPGTKQDWLTRPIGRVDVLLAKVMFAALVVQGSGVVGDVMQGVAAGFPLRQTLGAALARAAVGFIAITVPALVIGALTQSIADAMVMSAVFGSGIFAFTLLAIALGGGYEHQFDPTNGSGVEWIPNLLRFVLVLAGGAVVMLVQYRTRKTLRGRMVMAGVVLVMLCSQAIPWRPVFAIEERLSPKPGATDGIGLAWASDSELDEQAMSGDPAQYGIKVGEGSQNDETRVRLPIRITGLPADSVLRDDNAKVEFADASGKSLDVVDAGLIEVRREDGQNRPVTYTQIAKIPAQIFQAYGDRMVHVSTTHSLTLFRLSHSYAMAAVGGDQRMAGWGRCESKINAADTAVEVTCMQMGKGPTCATVFLDDPRDGTRNPVNTSCFPNYSPYIDRPIPDAVSHFRLVLPFRDTTRQLKYPVDVWKVGGAQVAIRVYEPVDHFTRVVASPPVAMNDLAVR